jgi:hypothetical protein
LRRVDFVQQHHQFLFLLHTMGKTYGRAPSQWILNPSLDPNRKSRWSMREQLFALDFDAATLVLGIDMERRLSEEH